VVQCDVYYIKIVVCVALPNVCDGASLGNLEIIICYCILTDSMACISVVKSLFKKGPVVLRNRVKHFGYWTQHSF